MDDFNINYNPMRKYVAIAKEKIILLSISIIFWFYSNISKISYYFAHKFFPSWVEVSPKDGRYEITRKVNKCCSTNASILKKWFRILKWSLVVLFASYIIFQLVKKGRNTNYLVTLDVMTSDDDIQSYVSHMAVLLAEEMSKKTIIINEKKLSDKMVDTEREKQILALKKQLYKLLSEPNGLEDDDEEYDTHGLSVIDKPPIKNKKREKEDLALNELVKDNSVVSISSRDIDSLPPSFFDLFQTSVNKTICSKMDVSRYHTQTSKWFCWDILKYTLDAQYYKEESEKQKRMREKMKSSRSSDANEETDDLNCICSSYFGVSEEFVYMNKPGSESLLFIEPEINLNFDNNKKREKISVEPSKIFKEVDNGLIKFLGMNKVVKQPSSILVDYYKVPSKGELKKRFNNTYDIPNYIKKLGMLQRYLQESEGNIISDYLNAIGTWVDNKLFSSKKLDHLYSIRSLYQEREKTNIDIQKELLRKLIAMREQRRVKMEEESENEMGFLGKTIKAVASVVRFGEKTEESLIDEYKSELTYVKKEVVKRPYSSCLIHCKKIVYNIRKSQSPLEGTSNEKFDASDLDTSTLVVHINE